MDYVKTSPTKRRKSTASRPQTIMSDTNTVPTNKTLFQAFEWYVPATTTTSDLNSDDTSSNSSKASESTKISHWQNLAQRLPHLKSIGVDAIWIPPACKASEPDGNGYDIYDLWDLGEFDAKGTVGTKWGTKAQLVDLCHEAEQLKMGVIFDAVLNHRAGAEGTEEVEVVRCDDEDRTVELDDEPIKIDAWTSFPYKARNGKYSDLKYDRHHFNGVDWDARTEEKAIYKFQGTRPDGSKQDWADDVDKSFNGNYDMLLFSNVDYTHPKVKEDVKKWGVWLLDTLPGLTGFRLDAIKHYSSSFIKEFVAYVSEEAKKRGREIWWVGENFSSASANILEYNKKNLDDCLNLFEIKLLYNFLDASNGKLKDLRRIFDDTVISLRPDLAVTIVANHDTQEAQTCEAPIQPWFVPHAYALILLRQVGHPCVFWGDLYGTHGPQPREPACGGRLARLIKARELYAYGEQQDYFDAPNCVAWTWTGHASKSGGAGMAVVVSNAWSWKKKRMNVGKSCAGQIWSDLMGWAWGGVQIDEEGYGDFVVGPRSISVWTNKDAQGREEIDNLVYPPETPIEGSQNEGQEDEGNGEEQNGDQQGDTDMT